MPRLRMAIIAASTAALAVPAAAQATVPCDFDKDQKRLTASFTTPDEVAHINRDGVNLKVDGFVCTDEGVTATVNNTNTIAISDPSGENRHVQIDLYGGAFAPGATDEGDGDSEIEWDIDMGTGTDTVDVVGDTINDNWTFGAIPGGSGINLNAGAEPGDGADVDVETTGVNRLEAYPGDGNDTVSASSISPAFNGPAAVPVGFDGGDHDDVLIGGSAGDELAGGTATDVLGGAGGADELRGEAGKDYMDGGADVDEADYENFSGVTVDLRVTEYQNTQGAGEDRLLGIENLAGSSGNDTLTGNNADNRLLGRSGLDTLTGHNGADEIDGEGGLDTASYATAPAGVSVGLAEGQQNTQGAGTDTVLGTERLIGSAHADDLRGTNGPNVIDGGAGQDKLSGLGDADSLLVRDGEGDDANCGGGDDMVVTDVPGLDVLTACEQVDALPAPPVPPADDNGGNGGDGGNGGGGGQQPGGTPPGDGTQPGGGTVPSGGPSGTPSGDTTKPVITGLKRRGRRLQLRLSENARISFAVRRGARKAKTINKLGVSGLNRVRLAKLRPGTYRVLIVATDEAGNRTTKKLTFRVRR